MRRVSAKNAISVSLVIIAGLGVTVWWVVLAEVLSGDRQ